MYQLVWVNFGSQEHHAVIGSIESVLQVYCLIKDKKWDVFELWQLGAPTVRLNRDGRAVTWW